MPDQPTSRDFRGYGGTPPQADWPDGARVAVSVVVNVEEGAELSVTSGDESNEGTYEAKSNEAVTGAPDPCMESHFEYGTRAGYWRIADLLEQHGVPATMSCCARALKVSPWLAEDILRRGHEISAHGYRWETHAGMAEDHERRVIADCVETIREVAGVRPLGWHTRSATSPNTRRLLVEEGGFLYDSNAYNDDLPYLVTVNDRPHVVLPYAFDTNDMRFHPGAGFIHAEDFSRYCIAAFDRLWTEGARTPKMMSIGLHLRLIGKPARIGGLEALLDHIRAKGQVWFARRDAIARHWRHLNGLPAWPTG